MHRISREQISFASSVAVRVGARDLLAIEPSMEQVKQRLERYSLAQILALLGRVGSVFRDDSRSEREKQEILASAFFPPSQLQQLKQRAVNAARVNGRSSAFEPYVMFDAQVVKALAIFAGATVDLAKADTNASPKYLGEALLVLNDLFDEEVKPPPLKSVDAPDLNWVYYFAASAYRFSSEPTVTAIVRAVELFLDPLSSSELAGRVDLASAFKEETGLELEAYLLICIAVIGKMLEVDATNVHHELPILPRSYFGNFDRATQEQFFKLTGLSVESFCERAKQAWPPGATRPRHWLPLETSPFVWTRDFGICISTEELERRLTVGLYHTLLNARRSDGAGGRAFSAAVQREVGSRFEGYVERSFQRIRSTLAARSSWHPRDRRHSGPVALFRESEVVAMARKGARDTPSTSDMVFLIGTDLLIVEAKAKFFDLEARTGRSQERFLKRLHEIVIYGARQIDATVKHLRQGRLASAGLTMARVRRVFPIVVSLDPIALSPLLRSWIDHQLGSERLLGSDPGDSFRMLPLEILSARDLEWLEAIVESTVRRPGDLLQEKLGSEAGRGLTLSSWSSISQSRSGKSARSYPRYHGERWDELSERAAAYFRALSIGDDD